MYQKKEIAFVIHGLVMGGAEKFLISLINDFDRRGFRTFLVLLSEDNRLLNELNTNTVIKTILRKSRFDIFISHRIKQAIESRGIRTIFCINTYSFFLTKLAYLFNSETSFFLSLHSTIPSSTRVFLQNMLYFRLVRRKDNLLYLCDYQKTYLNKTYFLQHDFGFVINNGINTQFYDPALFRDVDRVRIKQALNITSDAKVILQVARLHPEKGHKDSLIALSTLHSNFGKRAHLVVVGGGTSVFLNHLTQLRDQQSLTDHVHFVGEQKDIVNYLCIADLFTLTSFGTETFSLAALEAMSFGIPCSLTNIGGASEMIIDGINGKLSSPQNPFSIAESWNTILDSPMDKSIIRDLVVKRFDSKRMFDRYAAVIE